MPFFLNASLSSTMLECLSILRILTYRMVVFLTIQSSSDSLNFLMATTSLLSLHLHLRTTPQAPQPIMPIISYFCILIFITITLYPLILIKYLSHLSVNLKPLLLATLSHLFQNHLSAYLTSQSFENQLFSFFLNILWSGVWMDKLQMMVTGLTINFD